MRELPMSPPRLWAAMAAEILNRRFQLEQLDGHGLHSRAVARPDRRRPRSVELEGAFAQADRRRRLERQFPGIAARLVRRRRDRRRAGCLDRRRHLVARAAGAGCRRTSEIHFLPAIGGGKLDSESACSRSATSHQSPNPHPSIPTCRLDRSGCACCAGSRRITRTEFLSTALRIACGVDGRALS